MLRIIHNIRKLSCNVKRYITQIHQRKFSNTVNCSDAMCEQEKLNQHNIIRWRTQIKKKKDIKKIKEFIQSARMIKTVGLVCCTFNSYSEFCIFLLSDSQLLYKCYMSTDTNFFLMIFYQLYTFYKYFFFTNFNSFIYGTFLLTKTLL